MSAAVVQPSSSSRLRTQARKKVNDDAAYFGPPASTGMKRQAADKAEGEPRVKRKRVETNQVASTSGKKDAAEPEPRKSLVEFQKMSTSMLHRYLMQYSIVPRVYPSPLSPEDPPAPSSLADPERQTPRPPSPPAEAQIRRRSSRLLEEEPPTRVPILADIVEVHGRHFREVTSVNSRDEVDTLASFMCAVEKSKGAKNVGNTV
ncbi:hypothetical protein CPB84DRAFT_1759770 [Gymnopilus junonius]|uniref:Uncharacterized protein n=1 Tax=Gymnopilus junonius TaxID=109634 RepID=A0A9P5TV45_GYMJU|nr:hypothetical protein CPB84DRAFT_1759770 [Gymnopilus junonius]